jgi:hypothetical protein
MEMLPRYPLGKTTRWYSLRKPTIENSIERALDGTQMNEIYLLDEGIVPVTPEEINRIYNSFGKNALDRSCLGVIHLRDTTNKINGPMDINKLIRSRQISDFNLDREELIDKIAKDQKIEICGSRNKLCKSPDLERIVYIQKLYKEIAKTIIYPAQRDNPIIITPRGSRVMSQELIQEFKSLAEKHEPISLYSSYFRENSGHFINSEDLPLNNSIAEEFAETIAAYFLGFAFKKDKEFESMNPFQHEDSLKIKKLTKDFLMAKLDTSLI